MTFADTQPAPVDPGDGDSGWSRFKVRDPRRRVDILRELCRADRPLTLGTPGGDGLTAALWAVDDDGDRLHLRPNAVDAARRAAVLGCPDPWGAAYLDGAKLQFALPGLAGSADGEASWTAPLPQTMYLLPRRQAVRVRRHGDAVSLARVPSRRRPGAVTVLRLLDVSESGCAVELPPGLAAPPQGATLRQVEIDLDETHVLFTDLVVHHRSVDAPGRGSRLGCRWQGMAPAAQERLRRWIRQGQRRRELISLSLD